MSGNTNDIGTERPPTADAPEWRKPPIFIGGTGRSGTTMLYQLLGQHPSIRSLRWETGFLVMKNGLIDLIQNDMDSAHFAAFKRRLTTNWFRRVIWEGTPREYSAGLCADIPYENIEACLDYLQTTVAKGGVRGKDLYSIGREAVNRLFRRMLEGSHAIRWAEKTPRNILLSDRLALIFPGMKFVHVIRDPRDTICSLLKFGAPGKPGGWPIGCKENLNSINCAFPELGAYEDRIDFELSIGYWRDMLHAARKVAESVPADSYLEVRYEDLILQPESTLERLMAFLGEAMDLGLLNFDFKQSSVGRWKKDLSMDQLRVVNQLIGDAIEKEGYEPM